jgi:hypothetical protein
MENLYSHMNKKGNKNILFSGFYVPDTGINGPVTLLSQHRAL